MLTKYQINFLDITDYYGLPVKMEEPRKAICHNHNLDMFRDYGLVGTDQLPFGPF